jgi:long-subunit acyl-CoA synthetase (AMP-forming)
LDDENYAQQTNANVATFKDFFDRGETSRMSEADLAAKKSLVRASDVINYQFTSGTTGAPKAAMLSHV